MKDLGTVIKELRKDRKLTQKELAEGICAQSMLSAIENNVYVPNANLLIKLATKLEVSLDQVSLATNFPISSKYNFNDKVDDLCNNHQYQELYDFLMQDKVLNNLKTSLQMQAYYYYLGVAQLQTNAISEAERSLDLSLAEVNSKHPNTLGRLAYMAIGYVHSLENQKDLAEEYINKAFRNWDEFSYEENQNALYYLAALIYFKLNDYQDSTAYIADGIGFIAKHNSHYMLANCYFLLARLALVAHNDDERLEANRRKDLFTELYGENIFEKF